LVIGLISQKQRLKNSIRFMLKTKFGCFGRLGYCLKEQVSAILRLLAVKVSWISVIKSMKIRRLKYLKSRIKKNLIS